MALLLTHAVAILEQKAAPLRSRFHGQRRTAAENRDRQGAAY